MSEYFKRFSSRLRGLNLPPEILPLAEEAFREHLELISKVQKLEDENAYLQGFKDELFTKAFCASLGGMTANPNMQLNLSQAEYVEIAIKYAQEAVRQVGELNKEQSE